jgi:DNA-directed RNA polymerase subunit M/transcription elongation factor TFIIS
MKFCTVCDNMYYISINEKDSNLLSYYCRSCGHIDDTITEEGICILNTQLKQGHQKFNHIINEYTKMDPTLPRIYNIPCPNAQCSSKSECSAESCSNPEIIYMRYDDSNLKYLYICTKCDFVWKTDDSV